MTDDWTRVLTEEDKVDLQTEITNNKQDLQNQIDATNGKFPKLQLHMSNPRSIQNSGTWIATGGGMVNYWFFTGTTWGAIELRVNGISAGTCNGKECGGCISALVMKGDRVEFVFSGGQANRSAAFQEMYIEGY